MTGVRTKGLRLAEYQSETRCGVFTLAHIDELLEKCQSNLALWELYATVSSAHSEVFGAKSFHASKLNADRYYCDVQLYVLMLRWLTYGHFLYFSISLFLCAMVIISPIGWCIREPRPSSIVSYNISSIILIY